MSGGRGSTQTAGRVAAGLVLMLLVLLAIRTVEDPDVGYHLRAGERLLSGQGWMRTDPFTFTLTDRTVVDTTWGYQVVLALLERTFSAPGLVAFHALLVLLTFLVLLRTARVCGGDWVTLTGLLLLGGLAAEVRFETRPELVSYLLLSLVLLLLHRRATGLPAPLWLLPAIHLIWANCHSFFFLGWVAIGCFAVGGLLRERKLDRPLLGWGAAAVGVTLVNPYGLRGVLFPLTLVTRAQSGNPFRQTIGELASPFNPHISAQFPFFPMLPVHCFQLFAAGTLLGIFLMIRRRRYDLGLLAAAFLIPASSMIRNMPLLVVAALPGLAGVISSRWVAAAPVAGRRGGARLRVAALTLLATVTIGLSLRVYHDAYYIGSRRPTRFGFGWNRLALPITAAEFATWAGLDGRVLNHLDFGGTLLWRWPRPVFIHARLETVGEAFYWQYLGILGSDAAREAAVSRYGIHWIIFPYVTNGELLRRLSRDPRWRMAYVDPVAAVFVRDGEARPARFGSPRLPGEEPAKLSQDTRSLPGLGGAPRRGALETWLSGFVRRERYPAEDFNLGLYHFYRGEPRLAQLRFARAIERSSGAYYEMYLNLAATLYWQGRFAEARRCDQVVLEADPTNPIALERLRRSVRGAGFAPPGLVGPSATPSPRTASPPSPADRAGAPAPTPPHGG